jgi:hypothetical protein
VRVRTPSSWRAPLDTDLAEARTLVEVAKEFDDLELDPVVALALLLERPFVREAPTAEEFERARQMARDGEAESAADARWQLFGPRCFGRLRRWYRGRPAAVLAPEQSCPGIEAAAETLRDTIARGDRVAVFCDYDVDGTSAGEVLRQALAPYGANLHFGYADAARGFGLSNEFVEAAADAGCTTLITLDCGSGSAMQIARAKQLGLQVIVVDHHDAEDMEANPADHHLNPTRWRVEQVDNDGDARVLDTAEVQALVDAGTIALPAADAKPVFDGTSGEERLGDAPGGGYYRLVRRTSLNTGAQLAWKLGAAVQQAHEGQTRPEHWQRALYLAGLGALADYAPVALEENRAFYWHASEYAPPGIVALARRFDEDPTAIGELVRTRAVLNLAKRTPEVSAEDTAALLAAESEEQAAPIVDKLLAAYEAAQPVKRRMEISAREQAAAHAESPLATAVLENVESYAGYAGQVARAVASDQQRPALVVVPKGVDEHGQDLCKIAIRVPSRFPYPPGELKFNEELQQACLVVQRDAAGEIVEQPSLGGHEQVVSGMCRRENIERVVAAVSSWADGKQVKVKRSSGGYGPLERLVAPERLSAIEAQARRLGPFSYERQPLQWHRALGRGGREQLNVSLQISVAATLSDLRPDPDSDKYLRGTLKLADGQVRDAVVDASAEWPLDEAREWVLRVGERGPYFLREHVPLAGG